MKNEEENLILQSLMEEKTIQKQQQKEMKKQLKFDVLVEGEGNKDINQYMKKKGKKEKERNDVPRTILDYVYYFYIYNIYNFIYIKLEI